MLFKKMKKLPYLELFSHDSVVYQGFLKDLPLKESVILEKSIAFFSDPEPCHIHRNAVRIRITEDIYEEQQLMTGPAPCMLLRQCVEIRDFDRAVLSEKEI